MKKLGSILVIILIVGGVIGTFWFLWNNSQPEKVYYEWTNAEHRTLVKTTVATGSIEPRNEISIKPQISGIISEILKEAGDKVKKGDIIAKVKVVPDMASLNSANTTLKKARINLDKVNLDFFRKKKLLEKGIISKVDFQTYEVEKRNAEADLEQAQNNYEIVKDGVSKSATEASLTFIRATVEGTILDVPEKVGNSVIQSNNFNDGTTIASIADMSDMLFVGTIDETEVGKVVLGSPIALTIGALNDQVFNAKLEYISPKGVESNGAVMFEVKAAVEIPENIFIRSGYSANGEIILDKRDSVLAIPEGSLQFTGDSIYVNVRISEEPVELEERLVKVGLSDGLYIQILDGLSVEDVITTGKTFTQAEKEEQNKNTVKKGNKRRKHM